MKRNYKTLIIIVVTACILSSFRCTEKSNPEKNRVILQVIGMMLTEGHYQPRLMNDEFSEYIYDEYLDMLDPTKRFFYQSDIDSFDIYRHQLDDDIIAGNLSFFYRTYDIYQKRVKESKQLVRKVLKTPFNLKKNESLDLDYDSITYANNELDMLDRWRKQIKWRYITTLYDKQLAEKDKLEQDSTYTTKTLDELKKEAIEKTEKNMNDMHERMTELDEDDFFGMFINVVTTGVEPHTNYMTPKIKDQFDISMSGKLEGIGARLQKDGEYIKIVELISGGPAWRAGELEKGDLILKVAEGDAEPVDIVGMRLDDAIDYIKGKKGTEVRLTLKKVNGTIQTISIVRDIVEIEETYLKSSLVKKGNRTFGVIDLPKFYFDMYNKTYHNSSSDMKDELNRMKKAGVDGVLIDLRNNGGGSLKTAIEISGMFIDQGPVVQVKYRGQPAQVYNDEDKGVIWDKPLVILINENSASASEIFSAAMQDYERAIILGSKQTYGKGTVQNFFGLNDHFTYPEDLGSLKMTIQKFYRINGGSTQLKGVTPDIITPSRYAYLGIGEKDEKNPLEWDKIKAANYSLWKGYTNRSDVIKKYQKEIDTMAQFQLIDQSAKWLKLNKEDKIIPLNYDQFVKEIKDNDAKADTFDVYDDYQMPLEFTSMSYEVDLIAKDSILGEKRKRWHKALKKDVMIEKGLGVLNQLELKK